MIDTFNIQDIPQTLPEVPDIADIPVNIPELPEAGEVEKVESVITGLYFEADGKFSGYVYNDYTPDHAVNIVQADEELIAYIMELHKATEIKYTGEFGISLTIEHKELFTELEAVIVKDKKAQEILDLKIATAEIVETVEAENLGLKIAMAEMSEEKDAEILNLKLALAELVEGGI